MIYNCEGETDHRRFTTWPKTYGYLKLRNIMYRTINIRAVGCLIKMNSFCIYCTAAKWPSAKKVYLFLQPLMVLGFCLIHTTEKNMLFENSPNTLPVLHNKQEIMDLQLKLFVQHSVT